MTDFRHGRRDVSSLHGFVLYSWELSWSEHRCWQHNPQRLQQTLFGSIQSKL